MQVSVTFKNLDPSDNLKSYVKDKLDKFDKLLGNPVIATVVLLVEKFRHTAEINLTGDRLKIVSKEETDDMYSAIDMAMDKVEKQIKKSKQKSRNKRSGSKGKEKGIIDQDMVFTDSETEKQIRIMNIEYKPMDIDEAIMQMELVTNNFLVFTNSKTDKVNVLYRRNDGEYGLIQPSR